MVLPTLASTQQSTQQSGSVPTAPPPRYEALVLALIIALLCTLLLVLMGYTFARRWLKPGSRTPKSTRPSSADQPTPWEQAGQRAEPISKFPDMDDD